MKANWSTDGTEIIQNDNLLVHMRECILLV